MTDRLTRPVAADSLRAFRIAYGLLMAVALARFWAHGWIDTLLLAPAHRFSYLGFDRVAPLPRAGMHALFAGLILLALGLAAGRRPRLCALLFALGFGYIELLDKTLYLNHYYLATLLALLLAVLPHGRATVPFWAVLALRVQLGLVYVFAGLAKCQPDWLLDGQPLGIWLGGATHLTEALPWLATRDAALLASWAGCLFDLTIPLWLSLRRTRWLGMAAVWLFHLGTALLFPRLGLFPWMMIALSPIFLAPDWPRRALGRTLDADAADASPATTRGWRPALVGAFLLIQLALPLRHHLYPGDVLWTEQGFRFAWKVMLIEKAGVVDFTVTDDDGRRWAVDLDDYFTPRQRQMLATQPDLLAEAARIIAADFRARGVRGARVTADAWVSLNGGPTARLVDPTVDLARVPRTLAPAPWIRPRPR